MANVTVKFTVLDPNQKIIKETGESEVWINRPVPRKRALQLSVDFIQIQAGEKYPNIFYTVKALVYDKNSDTKIDLERRSKVIEDKQNSRFIWAKIISTPRANKGEITPKSTMGFRHMAIVSDVLPQGIWEVGPDKNGRIITTNTVVDLSAWQTYLVTQKCLELGGDHVKAQFVEVNKQGLIDSMNLYEKRWVGEKYIRSNHNENYAVETVIYGAGGDIRKAKKEL